MDFEDFEKDKGRECVDYGILDVRSLFRLSSIVEGSVTIERRLYSG